jgi:hypothetical protein
VAKIALMLERSTNHINIVKKKLWCRRWKNLQKIDYLVSAYSCIQNNILQRYSIKHKRTKTESMFSTLLTMMIPTDEVILKFHAAKSKTVFLSDFLANPSLSSQVLSGTWSAIVSEVQTSFIHNLGVQY